MKKIKYWQDTKDTLPNKPSKILKVALKDLIKVENLPKKYTIDMGTWYDEKEDKPCVVCHAGAVMACSLKLSTNDYVEPYELKSTSLMSKIEFINSVRVGEIISGLELLNSERVITDNQLARAKEALGPDRISTGYYDYTDGASKIPHESAQYATPRGRIKYKAYIEGVIGILQAEGL